MKELLVYIGGAGHTGSTLLDLLLNNSPLVQSVGEVHKLNRYARTEREPCTCGQPIMACPFWQRVQEEYRRALELPPDEPLLQTRDMMLVPEDLGPVATSLEKALLVIGSRGLFRTLLPRIAPAHARAVEHSLRWYAAIRRVSGCPVILESSKDPRRLKVIYLADPDSYRLIYMMRDGRAVTASAMRREGLSMADAARQWVDVNRRTRWSARGIPQDRVTMVHYETLCREPGPTLQRVCGFIGIPYDESMLVMRKAEAHNIAGNPMRFRHGEVEIRLDERWRDELSADDLAVFEQVAGRWNRHFDYTD